MKILHDLTSAAMTDKRSPPAFFEEVQRKAQARWDQLDADPELAGPWNLLFAQVQSPRHVLSELLQNADDAGAKTATARIVGDLFIFTHDGEDFDREQFASLCRFGYSNKRKLHTIGFRGIGFKSTFSLGDFVEVWTPTLAVGFKKQRFTEPLWIDSAPIWPITWVRVKIRDDHRRQELEKNLSEWAQSAASLLFFNSITKLVIHGKVIEKHVQGTGPVGSSERVTITAIDAQQLIVFRSPEEPFPPEAIEEIRRERNATDLNLPPCRVELVLGLPAEQRLYVVLPTGVRPDLPFSCNAPFLQDPARFGIKAPSTSPTNRWLLQRLGELAGTALKEWIGNEQLNLVSRAEAYAIIPPPACDEDNLDSDCRNEISTGFAAAVEDTAILLTESGELVTRHLCLAPPPELYPVWNASEHISIFGSPGQRLLALEVSGGARRALSRWEWLTTVLPNSVLERLTAGPAPPRPGSAASLLALWSFAQTKVQFDFEGIKRRKLMIVPTHGQDVLCAAERVVRPAANQNVLVSDDLAFLTEYLNVIDDDWLGFLAEQENTTDTQNTDDDQFAEAKELLRALRLTVPTSWERILGLVSAQMSAQKELTVENLVRLTHIMAALNVQAPANFPYVTRSLRCRSSEDRIIFDRTGELEDLVPAEWAREHFLHEDYLKEFRSCTQQSWKAWAASERSGLRCVIPLETKSVAVWQNRLRDFLKERGATPPDSYPYNRGDFKVNDIDFLDVIVEHWKNLADQTIWSRVFKFLADDPRREWSNKGQAAVRQVRSSSSKAVSCGPILAAWVVRLQQYPCLPDTYGVLHQPAELLMRTPDTEPLMGIEPFIRAEVDTEATKPLLKLLGVRDTPSGVDKLLERIQQLATVESPPVHEVAKWYDALDRVLARCRPDDLTKSRDAFRDARLVLTQDADWARAGEVFLQADQQEIPDVAVVHSSVAQLAMWNRLGIAERPTADLVLIWLSRLESGKKLDSHDLKRVRSLIKRHAARAWQECGHWLSLDGSWTPTERLTFQVSMQALAKFTELFPTYKARTADLRMLSAETCESPPFCSLKDLGAAVEYRVTSKQYNLPKPLAKPWLRTLAECLQRVKLEQDQQTETVRVTARRLFLSLWQPFDVLHVTPYIEGTPAGQPSMPDVLWQANTIYVRNRPLAKIFNAIAVELARPFGLSSVAEAIRACAERDVSFVAAYLEDSFLFDAAEQLSESSPRDEAHAPALGIAEPGDAPVAASDINAPEVIESAETLAADARTAPETPAENSPPRPRRELQSRDTDSPTLISRFAAAKGYSWSGNRERFVHSDGSWLQKCEPGSGFNWELHAGTGEVLRRYWVTEQSLANGGIEVAAALWELLKQDPARTGFVLERADDGAQEVLGTQVLKLLDKEVLAIFPAKYRLRRNSN